MIPPRVSRGAIQRETIPRYALSVALAAVSLTMSVARAVGQETASAPGQVSERDGGLNLGPYRNHFVPPERTRFEGPRFESHIDVEGRVPPDPNETMAVWWKHFNFEPSIYGHGIAIQNGGPRGSVNILPLVEWIAKKVKDKSREGRKTP